MKLSVLIPARNEMWLRRTVVDVLEHSGPETEVIVVLDGEWPPDEDAPGDGALPVHERLKVVFLPEAIGQRAATNLAARLSSADYVMKLDAHCSVSDGFDAVLIAEAERLGPDVTQVPSQHNLQVFCWKCRACGRQEHQGPRLDACAKCGRKYPNKDGHDRVIHWRRRHGVLTEAWHFDSELRFKYWGLRMSHPDVVGQPVIETMSLLGACWFLSRARYWQLGGLDEEHGSWGQMGTEIACKSWLSGGRVVTNRRCWFAHLFRTQGGEFGFPYPQPASQVDRARRRSLELWKADAWPGAVRPLSWLLEKFWPVPGWTEEQRAALGRPASPGEVADMVVPGSVGAPAASPPEIPAARAARPTGTVLYYSDCLPDAALLQAVRQRLLRVIGGHEVVSATLQPVDFGENIVVDGKRSEATMFRQILAGLEAARGDYVFLAEHDVAYSASHFAYAPSRADLFWYDQNCVKLDAATGRALFYICNQTSMLVADRGLLLAHYRARVERVAREGFTRRMGFEPGTRQLRHGGVDDNGHGTFMAALPSVDIRHGRNLTASRWSQAEFRNKKFCQGWTELDRIQGYGPVVPFELFLHEVANG